MKNAGSAAIWSKCDCNCLPWFVLTLLLFRLNNKGDPERNRVGGGGVVELAHRNSTKIYTTRSFARAHRHTRTHARRRARAHTHTHTHTLDITVMVDWASKTNSLALFLVHFFSLFLNSVLIGGTPSTPCPTGGTGDA